jgi:hypothetical protein
MVVRVAMLVVLAIFLAGSHVFAQDRGGFTVLVDIGVGVQHDTTIDETRAGLAGLNVGIGGFLTRDFALMFRIATTTVSYDLGASGYYSQLSGFSGPSLQYWLSDRFNLEAGAGVGFWSVDNVDETGLGLLFGVGVTIFNRGKHNLQFGVQYVPAFTDPGTVHSIGFTFGYQFL